MRRNVNIERLSVLAMYEYCTFLFLHKLNVLNKIVMNCCNLKGSRLIRKLEKPKKKKRGKKRK